MSLSNSIDEKIKDLIENKNSKKLNDEIILKAMKDILSNEYSNTKLEVRDLENGKKEYTIVISEN